MKNSNRDFALHYEALLNSLSWCRNTSSWKARKNIKNHTHLATCQCKSHNMTILTLWFYRHTVHEMDIKCKDDKDKRGLLLCRFLHAMPTNTAAITITTLRKPQTDDVITGLWVTGSASGLAETTHFNSLSYVIV